MTSRTKNIVLIASFLILIILSYKWGVAKTLLLIKEKKELSHQIALVENMPEKLQSLNQQKVYYNKKLEEYKLNGNSIQSSLLKTINDYSDVHNLRLVNFLEPHINEQNGLIEKTYQFTLEGNYSAIESLIYKLEQQTKFGEIISLHFERNKNYRTGRYFIQAHVLLKSFG